MSDGSRARPTPRPKGIRRVERWLVGLAMAVVAFGISAFLLTLGLVVDLLRKPKS